MQGVILRILFMTHPESIAQTALYEEAIQLLKSTLEEAQQFEGTEPNAMTLATCDFSGRPTARTVMLRDVSRDGLIFYTNETSVKGGQIAENPRACVVFFWPQITQQIVVEGTVKRLSVAETESNWNLRPRDSQLAAWASDQSSPVRDESALKQQLDSVKERFRDRQVPRPDYWFGYCLVPVRIEFWKAGWHILNERTSYQESPDGWIKKLLNP
jgi:pyridoxamine 5'-phosphate oxidase